MNTRAKTKLHETASNQQRTAVQQKAKTTVSLNTQHNKAIQNADHNSNHTKDNLLTIKENIEKIKALATNKKPEKNIFV
jgi:hypothetical protein